MAYFSCLVFEQTILAVILYRRLLMNYSFLCDRLPKARQLAWGERNSELIVDIHCVGSSSKMACSACPKLNLLSHRNVWKGDVALGGNVLQLKHMILLLWVKMTINIAIIYISWLWYCGIGKQFLLGLHICYHFQSARRGRVFHTFS